MEDKNYLHGYTPEEQARLEEQAKILEPYVYQGVDLANCPRVLEVGCGIGAQTKILLKRFGHIQRLVGLDISAEQLEVAAKSLTKEIGRGQVQLFRGDARDLSILGSDRFEGAFLCWFLEHVPDPLAVLKEVKKYLVPQARIILSEVNNSSFFVDPYSPEILKYWMEFNDYQWSINGHPYVGVQLGNLLLEAGYNDISIEHRSLHFDARQPSERDRFLVYFRDLLLSAAPGLIKAGRITTQLVKDVEQEFLKIQSETYSVLHYSWVRAIARA